MIGETVNHYEITEKLGAGGMGEVFLATDTRLGRQVALKFLPREYATDPERRQRLELEATSASSLDHPNILTIYEIDEHEGRPFIAMAYVAGRTLGERVAAEEIPLDDAIRYGVQLAGALGAAHNRGIVHRDVKPDNVLLGADDRVRLTDFGLAKLKESSGITSHGSTVGTVGYMSPEQAQGLPVDARSDVFSLGVILYELLTGKKPFAAEHAAAALYSIVHEDPRPIRDRNPKVPVELSGVVTRMLSKDPRERYADGAEAEAALRELARALEVSRISSSRIQVVRFRRRRRWIWAAVGTTAIFVGLVFVLLSFVEPPTGTAKADENTLAVMRFENLSNTRDPERYGEIITELLTTDLSGSEFVTVVSSQRLLDLFAHEGAGEPDRTDRTLTLRVAHKAGATRMLTGSLSSLRGRQIITAQIVDVASGDVIGSERVDGDDLFAMVDDLSVRIKRRLGLNEAEVLAGDIPIAEATTDVPDAYREYLVGMEQYHSLNWSQARAHFENAIALDTSFALAYFRLGISYFSDGQEKLGYQYWAKARDHIDQTVGCDHLLLQAIAIDLGRNLDLQAALKTLKRATKEYPTHKEPFMWVGNISGQTHLRDTSTYYLRRALDLDPDYPFALLIYAIRLMQDKDYEKARPVVERYMRVRPDDVLPYVQLGNILQRSGRADSALIFLHRAVTVAPDHRLGYQSLGRLFVSQGNLDSALFWYGHMLQSDNHFTRLLGMRFIASAYQTWGRFDEALKYLERAELLADSAGMQSQRAQIHQNRGQLYYFTDRLDQALAEYEAAGRLDTLDLNAVYWKARLQAMLGHSEQARAAVDSIHGVWAGRTLTDNDVAVSESRIAAHTALSEGRYQAAIDAFREGRRLAEDSTVWRYSLGEAYHLAGQYDAAIAELTALQKEAELSYPSGDYLRSLYLLSDALVKSGRSAEAVAPLERLMVFWGNAEWDVPWMREAKRLYGSLTAQ